MFRTKKYLKTALFEAEQRELAALEHAGELAVELQWYKENMEVLQDKLLQIIEEKEAELQPQEDWYDGCDIVPATLLPGWKWTEYHDGSGSLESPDGKSYFQYDLDTKEYRHPGVEGNNWRFFSGYPYECIGFGEFKDFAERWILKNILCNQMVE